MGPDPASSVSRFALRRRLRFALLVISLVFVPGRLPAFDSPPFGGPSTTDVPGVHPGSLSSGAPFLLAKSNPAPAQPSTAAGAPSRAEEWQRTIRAIEPRVLKSGEGRRLLVPAAGDPGLSEDRIRAIRDEALLLLLAIQQDEVMRRLQLAGAPSATTDRLEREYGTARACLQSRFGASLPSVLDEARRNRAVLEALVHRLVGFPTARGGTGFPP